jgi:glycosyltransferase involved in cell wall biosynthesis
MRKWVCSQFGGREKYAIPRALSCLGVLEKLFTDIWVKPGTILSALNSRGAGRFHPDLQKASVNAFNRTFFVKKTYEQLFLKSYPLDTIFDEMVAQRLLYDANAPGDLFFGYSYSSRLAFKAAKSKGYKTILGQINPGPQEAHIVAEEYKKYANGMYKPNVPENRYWDLWKDEVDHADVLIVNSEWSRHLLMQEGIDRKKCVLIPLAYEAKHIVEEKKYPKKFDYKRPLRLLYLGGVELRKGFHILVEAMKVLRNQPVHLDVVGGLKGPKQLLQTLCTNITYHGLKPPHLVSGFYENADIFVFPTFSDGFGLTQLEAQSYNVPIITSPFCARIVTDGLNGMLLKDLDARSISDAVKTLLDQPELLPYFSSKSVSMDDYSIDALGNRLLQIA